MAERREEFGLALEAGEEGGIAGKALREGLDRDRAVETGVSGAIDLPHPACAEGPLDLVDPDLGTGA
jgi:hypothetical protein